MFLSRQILSLFYFLITGTSRTFVRINKLEGHFVIAYTCESMLFHCKLKGIGGKG